MRTGLPQGSLLGPLLLSTFINDINYSITNVSLRLYSDDTTKCFADYSPMLLSESKINADLNNISDLFASNCLAVNPTKTNRCQ